MSILVVMQDPQGLPRAWGIARTAPEAQLVAERHLEAWRAQERVSGGPLADAEFTSYATTVDR